MIQLTKWKIKASMALLLIAIAATFSITSCKKLDFTKTEPPNPLPDEYWLKYDDGTNYTGVFANSGMAFDIAVKFSTGQLYAYQGFTISKIKFFPLTGAPAAYSVTLWEGSVPDLFHVQNTTIVEGQWNTVSIDQPYTVNSSLELWVGVWIRDYPSGTYPAGCDDGPAIPGYGDLYSIDDGITWNSLFNADGLNYNWNLQVMLTSKTGEKVVLDPSGYAGDKDQKLMLLKQNIYRENSGMTSK
jgi:hypothetical protein